jgi:hypothetical protein
VPGKRAETVASNLSRRIALQRVRAANPFRSPGKRIASGGYHLISVTGNVTLEDLRVLAVLLDTAEQSYKIHVSNAGPRSPGAAPSVTVHLVALCY